MTIRPRRSAPPWRTLFGALLLLAVLAGPGAAFAGGPLAHPLPGASGRPPAPAAEGRGTHSVNFSEAGLPGGTSWGVTINSTTLLVAAPASIDVTLANGSYPYVIRDVAGWHQATVPYAGIVVVAGASRTMPTLAFVRMTYSVTFAPIGPAGVSWSVTLNGTGSSQIAPTPISFSVPNGTYEYRIAPVPGWGLAFGVNASGRISVVGASIEILVSFNQTMYRVRFLETGLPLGSLWSITVGAKVVAKTSAAIDVSEPNGSFTYQIGGVPGYLVRPSAGLAVVDGAPLTLSIAFSRVYSVSFVPAGLPPGILWGVLVNGTVGYSAPAPQSIGLNLSPGSYPYRVDPLPGYETAWRGTFDLATHALAIEVTFDAVRYEIAFAESGLPDGTSWEVALGGFSNASRAPSPVVFDAGNGSVLFSVVDPAGFSAVPVAGSLAVNGSPGIVRIQFVPNGALSFGQATGATFATIALAAIVPAAGLGGYVIVRRRRGGPPPSPASAVPSGGATRASPPVAPR